MNCLYAFAAGDVRCSFDRLQRFRGGVGLPAKLGSWRKGEKLVLPGPTSAPRSGPAGKSVWEGRDAGILSNMPLQDKLAYGAIYDQLANYEVQRLDERMTWLELAEYDGAQ